MNSASAFYGKVSNAGATTTIDTAYGLFLNGFNDGTVNNFYGIYLDATIDMGTNRYAIYSNSSSRSYFKGKIGVGTTYRHQGAS